MGFLQNDGDIILDAVLTDTGRMRLAKGDGSFKISKFGLADDEINYALYDKNNTTERRYIFYSSRKSRIITNYLTIVRERY